MTNDPSKRNKLFYSTSNTDLAVQAAQGDEPARRELVSRLLDPIRRTLSYLVRPAEDAEDLAQVAFVKILGSLGSFRGECSIEFWARRIAVRVASKHFKKHARRSLLSKALWTPSKSQYTIDDQIDRMLIRTRISKLLQKLSFDKRTAVVLHYVEGYTAAEIAEMTGVPVGTARDRLLRGRAQLKNRLISDPVVKDWFDTRKR